MFSEEVRLFDLKGLELKKMAGELIVLFLAILAGDVWMDEIGQVSILSLALELESFLGVELDCGKGPGCAEMDSEEINGSTNLFEIFKPASFIPIP